MVGRGYNKQYRYSYGGTSMGVAPTTANGFFQLFQDKNDTTWSSGDQVTSFAHNGHIYWLFGDSMLGGEDLDGSFADGTIMVGNRILLQQGDQFTHAVNGPLMSASVADLPTNDGSNGERYWTQGMFCANNHLYVLCQRVRHASGGMGFECVGGELAKFVQGGDGKLTLVAMIPTPSTCQLDVPGPKGIQWCGDAIVTDGYLYVYGSTRAEGNPYVAHFSYVARVPVAELENLYAWRFYKKTTNTWVSKISELDQDVVNQTDGVIAGQVSSVRKIGINYVMLHKPWNGWGTDVKALTSTTPWGWNPANEVTIFQSPGGTHEGLNYVTYSPQLHPEQVLTSGKTLVSIAWNGDGLTFAQMFQNADLYKPRFFEVQF